MNPFEGNTPPLNPPPTTGANPAQKRPLEEESELEIKRQRLDEGMARVYKNAPDSMDISEKDSQIQQLERRIRQLETENQGYAKLVQAAKTQTQAKQADSNPSKVEDAMDIDEQSSVPSQANKTEEVTKPHFFELIQKYSEEEKRLREAHYFEVTQLHRKQEPIEKQLRQSHLDSTCTAFLDLIKNQPQDVSQAIIMLLENRNLLELITKIDWNKLTVSQLNHFWEKFFSLVKENKENKINDEIQFFLRDIYFKCYPNSLPRRSGSLRPSNVTKRLSVIPATTHPNNWKDLFENALLEGYHSYIFNFDDSTIYLVPNGIKINSLNNNGKLRYISIPDELIDCAEYCLNPLGKNVPYSEFKYFETRSYLGLPCPENRRWAVQSKAALKQIFKQIYAMSSSIPVLPSDTELFLTTRHIDFWKDFLYLDIVDSKNSSQGIIVLSRNDYKANFSFLEDLIPYENRVELLLREGYTFDDYVRCFKDVEAQEVFNCTLENLLKLFSLAEFHSIGKLMKVCEDRLLALLNTNNVIQIVEALNASLLLSSSQLRPTIARLLWHRVLPGLQSEALATLTDKQQLLMQHCEAELNSEQLKNLGETLGPQIQKLKLAKITDEEDLISLTKFISLQELEVKEFEYTSKVATFISDCPDLSSISCFSINLSSVRKNPGVKYLKVELPDNFNYSKLFSIFPGIISLETNFKNVEKFSVSLQELTIVDNRNYFDVKSFRHLSNLKKLNLDVSRIDYVYEFVNGERRIPEIILPSVEELSVRDNSAFSLLSNHFPNTKILRLKIDRDKIWDRRGVPPNRGGAIAIDETKLEDRYNTAVPDLSKLTQLEEVHLTYVLSNSKDDKVFEETFSVLDVNALIRTPHLKSFSCHADFITPDAYRYAKENNISIKLT